MPPLELRWDPSRAYRSFVHEPIAVATIVSSEIVDDGRIVELPGVLITLDAQGCVCDLEIDRVSSPSEGRHLPSADAGPWTGPMATTIETSAAEPSATYADGWLLLRLQGGEGRWHRVAEDPLFLCTSDDWALLSIAATAYTDPDGSREAQWLDEIERGTRTTAA